MEPRVPWREDLAFRVAELERKLANVVRPGRIAEVDTARTRVRVQWGVQEDGRPAVSGWLPWLTPRAGTTLTWSAPSLGEQVLMLSPVGDMAQAFVLPAVYQIPLEPPTDESLHLFDAPDDHVIEIQAGTVRIRGNVEIDGGVNASSVAVTTPAGRISLGTHKHALPAPGTPIP